MAKRRKSPVKRKSPAKSSKNSKFGKRLVWILLLAGIGSFFYFWYIADSLVESPDHFRKSVPPGYPSIGIDVSHHQGKIDWEGLFKKGGFDTIIDFVYCKATEGDDFVDSQFERNRRELSDRGVLNGAYHYFMTKNPPRPQAAHFLTQWKKRDIDLPPVLDVEDEGLSDPDLIAKMKIWLTEVEEKSGMRPIIYTSLNFYETKFRNKFPGYKFWLAAYSREPVYMPDEEVIHWQYSESGRLPGIDYDVDLNVSKLPM